MKRTFRFLSITAGLLLTASVAMAGTQVQGSIVPADPDTTLHPQVGSKSKYKFQGKGGKYVLTLKGITDGAGAPAPVTNGTTSDTMYIAIVRVEALGTTATLNIPFNIEKKAGQQTVKGAVGLVDLAPGAAIGVSSVYIYQPTTPANAAACDAILFDPNLPGVYLGDVDTNPCAGGQRIGTSGIIAGS